MKKLVFILLILFQPFLPKASAETFPIPDIDWPLLGMELGLGGILGFSIGYFFKKSLKIILFAAGLITFILLLLSQFNYINIQWEHIEAAYSSTMASTGGSKEILNTITIWLKERIPLGGGLLIGFFAGLKMG